MRIMIDISTQPCLSDYAGDAGHEQLPTSSIANGSLPSVSMSEEVISDSSSAYGEPHSIDTHLAIQWAALEQLPLTCEPVLQVT